MSYSYRCTRSKCRARRALPRLIEDYTRVPSCRCCGGRLARDRAHDLESKQKRCDCDGLWFPHRRGSANCKDADGWHAQVAQEFGITETMSRDEFEKWIGINEESA